MTLATTAASVTAAGNGATTVWPFAFIIPVASELELSTINQSTQVVTVITDTTSFSVTGLALPGGGSVTYPLIGPPVATGISVSIRRIVPMVQSTDLVNQSGYYPEVVEGELDYLTMISQQLNEVLNRAVVVPVGSTTTPSMLYAAIVAGVNSASASAAAAAISAAAAATSASSAATSATTATTSASQATTSASQAASSASSAATSATTATTSASQAATSATQASTSASQAATSASSAATSATTATTSASQATTSASQAATSATQAAASAVAAAASAANMTGTSTTSLTPAITSTVVTTQAGKQWVVGSRLRAASASVPTVFFEGIVTAYSGTSLTINADTIGTATTKADWNIGFAGNPGVAGGAVVVPGTTVVGNIVLWNSTTGLSVSDSGKAINGLTADPGGNGFVVRTAAGSASARSLAAGTGVTVSNTDGTAGNPSIAVDKATAANIWAKTSNKVLTSDIIFTAAAAVSVAFAASIALDFATFLNSSIGLLTGNLTLTAPTNLTEGQCGTIYLQQDGTGGRTVTLNAAYEGAAFTMPVGVSARAALHYKVDKGGTKVIYTAQTTGLV